MALDAGMISALTKELQDKLTGSKLEKIHQLPGSSRIYIS